MKEAAELGLNRIKEKEWTPCCFPITLVFTLLHMLRVSTLGCAPSVWACTGAGAVVTRWRSKIPWTLKFLFVVFDPRLARTGVSAELPHGTLKNQNILWVLKSNNHFHSSCKNTAIDAHLVRPPFASATAFVCPVNVANFYYFLPDDSLLTKIFKK